MYPADRLFFPLAAAYALVAILLWLAALSGALPAPAPYWHAHEMLFGYALPVVAGYLVGRASAARLATLVALWAAARVAPWVPAASAYAAVPELAFVLAVAALTAWPFLRAAKKLQNRVFGPLLLAFFAVDLVFQVGVLRDDLALQRSALTLVLDLYALLLVMMGGRVIPAAVAGHHYRRGGMLQDRVQPALEKTIIALMVAMLALDVAPATRAAAGACAIAAAIVTAVRASRWRLWTIRDTTQLWALALGYLWLIPGLALKGAAAMTSRVPQGAAIHALTIGALGTMTAVMMARTHEQRTKGSLVPFADIGAAALLLGVAAIARLTAAEAQDALAWLWVSGSAWSIAFLLLLRRLLNRGQTPI
jgi:uncharacterized protein involved in response to NO